MKVSVHRNPGDGLWEIHEDGHAVDSYPTWPDAFWHAKRRAVLAGLGIEEVIL